MTEHIHTDTNISNPARKHRQKGFERESNAQFCWDLLDLTYSVYTSIAVLRSYEVCFDIKSNCLAISLKTCVVIYAEWSFTTFSLTDFTREHLWHNFYTIWRTSLHRASGEGYAGSHTKRWANKERIYQKINMNVSLCNFLNFENNREMLKLKCRRL